MLHKRLLPIKNDEPEKTEQTENANDEVLQLIEQAKREGWTELNLKNKKLTELPPQLWQLTNLTSLNLRRNQLTELPPEIGRLTNLTSLNLSQSGLTELPPEIGRLTNLISLNLSYNKLTIIPPQIERLVNLEILSLGNSDTSLVDLESNIENFYEKLNSLLRNENKVYNKNKIYLITKEFGNLKKLRQLYLGNNQIRELPPELGNLRDDVKLDLGGNPWAEPFDELVKGPQEELFAYLRSLQRNIPQYEAKVLLVGEGGVGKSSLLAALRNEAFVKDRDTTHGIERKPVFVEHPDPSVSEQLRLNFWDFGGQKVYRITHQFFFSESALYLLVWKAREGQEENRLHEWLELIRLRVGDTARVIIVATHSKERRTQLDFSSLKAKYGEILFYDCEVDSADGRGIHALKRKIARTVAQFDHIGTPFNPQWLEAKDRILSLSDTHVDRERFVALCSEHGLKGNEGLALRSIMHKFGHIIYYDSEGLRDFIILQPEWLTKAISYVLEDKQTNKSGGVLDHHRLQAIWNDHNNPKEWRFNNLPISLIQLVR